MRKRLLTPQQELNEWLLKKLDHDKALAKARKLKRSSQHKSLGWFHYKNIINLIKDETNL